MIMMTTPYDIRLRFKGRLIPTYNQDAFAAAEFLAYEACCYGADEATDFVDGHD